MTAQEFKDSLVRDAPPAKLSAILYVLWYDAKGRWSEAHNLTQSIPSKEGSLLHGYLHRKEGDVSNALYWYRNAGVEFPSSTLEEEWEMLLRRFL